MKRTALWVLALILGGLMATGGVWAADAYPDKEIRIITGTGAGGGVDRMARSVQRFLPEVIGASVLVENRPGAGGKVALSYVLKQPPDGYHIYAFHQPGITQIVQKNPDQFKLSDLAYININWTDPTIIVADKELGWKTIDDFVGAAKKEPGKYSFAAPSANSAGTIMSQVLFQKLGLDIKIVPYDGGGGARASFMGGHTHLTAGGAEGMLAVEQKAVPLGLLWKKPIPAWPNAAPINLALAKYNVKIPNSGSFRLFAVPMEFKEKYPERWNKLVASFNKLINEHKGFQEFCDKGSIGRDWLGPDEAWEMVKETDETFSKISVPKK